MNKQFTPVLATAALLMSVLASCGQTDDTAALAPFLNAKPVKLSSVATPPPVQLQNATSTSGDNNCTDGQNCGAVNQKQNQNLVGNQNVTNGHNTINGNSNLFADNGSVINLIGNGMCCSASPSPGPSSTPSPTPTPSATPVSILVYVIKGTTPAIGKEQFDTVLPGAVSSLGMEATVEDTSDGTIAQRLGLKNYSQLWLVDGTLAQTFTNADRDAVRNFRNNPAHGVLLAGEVGNSPSEMYGANLDPLSNEWGVDFVNNSYRVRGADTVNGSFFTPVTVSHGVWTTPNAINQVLGFGTELHMAKTQSAPSSVFGIGRHPNDPTDSFFIMVNDEANKGRVVFEASMGRIWDGSIDSPAQAPYIQNIANWLKD